MGIYISTITKWWRLDDYSKGIFIMLYVVVALNNERKENLCNMCGGFSVGQRCIHVDATESSSHSFVVLVNLGSRKKKGNCDTHNIMPATD